MNQMSTGDQSEYLRKKMAERRATYEQGGQFMRSGFQRWAENERPARQGGAMKEGLATASMSAGKDILDRVKSLGEDMFAQYYKGSARHIAGKHEESDSEEEEDVEGGRALAVGVEDEDMGRGYSGVGYSGNGLADTLAKGALSDLGKMAGKVGAPLLQPCEPGWKDEGVTCSKTVPKKLKTMGKGKAEKVTDEDIARMGRLPVGKGKTSDEVKRALAKAVEKAKSQVGFGKLEEHGADLIKMGTKGKGRLDCVHHEDGEGTHVRKVGRAKVPMAKEHGVKPSMETYEKQTLGKGTAKSIADKVFIKKEDIMGEELPHGSGRASRAALVKKIMKEKGLSLPAASKYVKEHGLYKK